MAEKRGPRRIAGWLASWVLLALLIIALTGSANLWSYLRIARHPAVVQGTVVALEPAKHDSVVVEYRAEGQLFTKTSAWVIPPNPAKNLLRVGDGVQVYYAPAAPDSAALGDPRERLLDELTAVLMAGFLGATVLVGGAALGGRRTTLFPRVR